VSVKLLYFASLREAVGTAAEEIALPPEVASVAALRDHLAARGGQWSALVSTKNLRCAVGQQLVGFDAAVRDGDEVAFFPPVTGG
jgi:sulfur-carrier protein